MVDNDSLPGVSPQFPSRVAPRSETWKRLENASFAISLSVEPSPMQYHASPLLKPVRTSKEHKAALAEVEGLWDATR